MKIDLSYLEKPTGKNFKFRYVVIQPTYIPKQEADKPLSPIWRVLGGFGCDPDSLGVKFRAKNLNGQVNTFTRLQVLSLVKREYVKDLVKKLREELHYEK